MPLLHTYYACGPVDLDALRHSSAKELDVRVGNPWTRIEYSGGQPTADPAVISAAEEVLVFIVHAGAGALEFERYVDRSMTGSVHITDEDGLVVEGEVRGSDEMDDDVAVVVDKLHAEYALGEPDGARLIIQPRRRWLNPAAGVLLAGAAVAIAVASAGGEGTAAPLVAGFAAAFAGFSLLLKGGPVIRFGGALVAAALLAAVAGVVGNALL